MLKRKLLCVVILLSVAFFSVLAVSSNLRPNSMYDSPNSVTATSGSASAIQTAVNQMASLGGGIVYVPAGTFHWNGETVTIPGGVSVIGYSPAGCDGHENYWKHYSATTIIINDAFQPIANPTFVIDGTGGKNGATRLSSIQIQASHDPTSESTGSGSKGIEVREAKNFRIDHCSVINFNFRQISIIPSSNEWPNSVGHSVLGLIDHCFFDAPYKDNGGNWLVAYGIDVFGNMQPKLNNWNPGVRNYAGKYQEFADVSLVYVEDCNFRRMRHSVDTENGGMAVVRYCLFDHISDESTNLWNSGELCEHPYWTSSQYPGLLLEAYYNTFVNVGKTGDPFTTFPPSSSSGDMHRNCPVHPNQLHSMFAIVQRGSSGIYYGNVYYNPDPAPNYYGVVIMLREESEGYPVGGITETYIWDEGTDRVTNAYATIVASGSPAPQLNTNYFTRQPTLAQDGWTYSAWGYPHQLVTGSPVPTPGPTPTPTPVPTATPYGQTPSSVPTATPYGQTPNPEETTPPNSSEFSPPPPPEHTGFWLIDGWNDFWYWFRWTLLGGIH